MRSPAGVGSLDDPTTSRHPFVATGADLRVAARALQVSDDRPTVRRRPLSALVAIGGGLLATVLIVIVLSVVLVSEDSKNPVVQVNPSSPASTALPSPSPTVAGGPAPQPAMTTPQAPAGEAQAPPPAPPPASLPQITAKTMIQAPPPPRHPRLHELFPHLFPDG